MLQILFVIVLSIPLTGCFLFGDEGRLAQSSEQYRETKLDKPLVLPKNAAINVQDDFAILGSGDTVAYESRPPRLLIDSEQVVERLQVEGSIVKALLKFPEDHVRKLLKQSGVEETGETNWVVDKSESVLPRWLGGTVTQSRKNFRISVKPNSQKQTWLFVEHNKQQYYHQDQWEEGQTTSDDAMEWLNQWLSSIAEQTQQQNQWEIGIRYSKAGIPDRLLVNKSFDTVWTYLPETFEETGFEVTDRNRALASVALTLTDHKNWIWSDKLLDIIDAGQYVALLSVDEDQTLIEVKPLKEQTMEPKAKERLYQRIKQEFLNAVSKQ